MSEQFRLRTGIVLAKGISIPDGIEMGQYEIDGTEEEIFRKVIFNLCMVFAKHYTNSTEPTAHSDFLKKGAELKQKYAPLLIPTPKN